MTNVLGNELTPSPTSTNEEGLGAPIILGPDAEGVRFFRGVVIAFCLAVPAWLIIGGLIAIVVSLV